MAYPGTILRLLVSAPGDLKDEDHRAVFDTINRWNVREGEAYSAAVVPIHWSDSSAAAYGARPQGSINEQLVDRADAVLAIFWHRLGSPTGEAESGTVEELERAAAAGKYVAVLRCTRPVPPGDIDLAQLERLRAFMEVNRQNALFKDYSDEASLANEVTNVLHVAVGRAQMTAGGAPGMGATRFGLPAPAQVWAGVDNVREAKSTDAKGNIKYTTRHYLRLTNRGDLPANHVWFTLENEVSDDHRELPRIHPEPHGIEVLAPGETLRYQVLSHSGSTSEAHCVTHWNISPDPASDTEEQVSTVFF